jgi:hypothetical protein
MRFGENSEQSGVFVRLPFLREKLSEHGGEVGRINFIQVFIHRQNHSVQISDITPGTLYVISGNEDLATVSF